MVQIITDSTSDITQADAAALGITVVPLTVHFGDAAYRDGVDLSVEDFYEKLAAVETLPTTSQVPPGEFTPLFQSFTDAGDDVVGIFISSEMSGTYQSAEMAKSLLGRDNIYVIDSRTATFELALLVHLAVLFRDKGMSAAEIDGRIRELIRRVKLYAVVDTLKYLKMSGRISGATAFVGGLLGINPIIAIDGGKVVSVGKTRGVKAGLKFIRDLMASAPPDPAYPAVFGHTNGPAALGEAVAYFTKEFDIPDYYEAGIGITVGTHVGPGAAGIAYIAGDTSIVKE
jgi:DegV family protein with EDD domain